MGVFTTSVYDSVGSRVASVDGLGFVTSFALDAVRQRAAWDRFHRPHGLANGEPGGTSETYLTDRATIHG